MLCAPGCWHGMLGGGGSMDLRSHAEWVSEAAGGSREHVLGELPGVRPEAPQELGPQEEARTLERSPPRPCPAPTVGGGR